MSQENNVTIDENVAELLNIAEEDLGSKKFKRYVQPVCRELHRHSLLHTAEVKELKAKYDSAMSEIEILKKQLTKVKE